MLPAVPTGEWVVNWKRAFHPIKGGRATVLKWNEMGRGGAKRFLSQGNYSESLTQSDQVPILHKKKIQGLRMAAQNLPIIFKERLNLCNQFGLNAADINFKATTMESDKFICVKATAPQGQKPKLKIVNLATNAVQEFPMGADSAIMNPMSQIVAVRSGGKLRTLNLELQSNMKGKARLS